MRKVLLMLLAMLAFMGVGAAAGFADQGPGGGGNSGPSENSGPGGGGNSGPGGGGCDNSGPGSPCNGGGEDCDKSGPGGDCKPDDNPPAEACPPATGPLSGVVQSVSDGIRNAGGAPLADLVDEINCGLLVDVLHVSASGTGL